MRKLVLPLLVAAAIFVSPTNTFGQAKTRIRFPAGASSTAVRGTIRGYAYRDYVVRATADQTINVAVASANTYTVFTIFRPGGDNLDGATQMDEFSGPLPVTGDFVIRVAMMRAGARKRGAVSNFTLKVSID